MSSLVNERDLSERRQNAGDSKNNSSAFISFESFFKTLKDFDAHRSSSGIIQQLHMYKTLSVFKFSYSVCLYLTQTLFLQYT
jgi:hypothetical protein